MHLTTGSVLCLGSGVGYLIGVSSLGMTSRYIAVIGIGVVGYWLG
jgi:hypothetical protein